MADLYETKLHTAVCGQLIELLRFTADFLNKHHLKWWLGYGSAIGAVRHKGIIPWDDDIDIIMPREDYNKLIHLQEDVLSQGFFLASMDSVKLYHFPFMKIMNRTSSIWEMKNHPFVLGSYIDIFPLDSCIDICDAKAKAQHLYKYLHNVQWGLERYNFGDILHSIKKRQFGLLLHIFRSKCLSMRIKDNYVKFTDYQSSISMGGGTKYVNYWGIYGLDREVVDKKYFEKTIEIQFEGITVNLPSDYDSYLKQIYGDYMQLPPKEKQVSHHHRYYENLKESLTIEEVKKRLNLGETLVM